LGGRAPMLAAPYQAHPAQGLRIRAGRQGVTEGQGGMWALRMGIKAVEHFEGGFQLSDEVQAALTEHLTSDKMDLTVEKQAHAAAAEFTGKLFQPVPYSVQTPHGMPADFEQYFLNPDYAIINVPPQIMFEAKCFKPSRLCAVYALKGVDPVHREAILSQKEAVSRRGVAPAPPRGGSPWAGMGGAMADASRMDPVDDDADLDSMVV